MKYKSKRKIEKSMESHVKQLLSTYFNNEHAQVVHGVSVISTKREIEICETLSNYAQMIERVFEENSYVYNKEWVKYVMDFY